MLLMELDPADQRPVYRQIVEEIERCVAVGVMRPDEALPAASTLAKDLKININTVQHAYRTLAQEGTVYIKRGLGTFVSPTPKENRQRTAVAARRIAERMLREGFKHGLLASDLIAALHEIAPKSKGSHS
ncbi:MAG: GntR family transcriptional regulator [Acidobacteriota bacterium]|nr:GntR family transcriptional regulator [Acidobacteriota bacterium]MDQ3417808.1 GntR family transcriptional regulator [Acidobacteriota bacterium]